MINKIISGGQSGVGRAALDVAIERGILHGGWIPKGRRTENGKLDEKYILGKKRQKRKIENLLLPKPNYKTA